MANHKRKGPKQSRSGCLICKWYKISDYKTAKRMKDKRDWQKTEVRAWTR